MITEADYQRRRIPLMFGTKLIDLADPHPDDVDLDAVHSRIASIRRFSGDPRALTVSAHSRAVWALARAATAPQAVVQWALCHDMHEAFTGDIPAPVKRYLSEHSPALANLEFALDRAICGAMKIPEPTPEIREGVRFFDKLAETLEWLHVLQRPEAGWNVSYTKFNVETFWSALHGEPA
jgi:5'-deoxynucleotidase YfbR-like HD superfamily hydrolase